MTKVVLLAGGNRYFRINGRQVLSFNTVLALRPNTLLDAIYRVVKAILCTIVQAKEIFAK